MGIAISASARRRSAIAPVAVALLLVLPAVASARGLAPAGCMQVSHHYQSQDVCAGPVGGEGQGPERYSYARLSGTATYDETNVFGCSSRTITMTGQPAFFAVYPNHTARARFLMTGTQVETEWSRVTDAGNMVCSAGFTTTPVDPWVLDVSWLRSDVDPLNSHQMCFSVVGCAPQPGSLDTVHR